MTRPLLFLSSLFILWSLGGQAWAQNEGLYFGGLHLKVRAEAQDRQFRLPSNAQEAALDFCHREGFRSALSPYFDEVRPGKWEVQDVICSHQAHPRSNLRQASKAYIAKQRRAKGLKVKEESQVLESYFIMRPGLFSNNETNKKSQTGAQTTGLIQGYR